MSVVADYAGNFRILRYDLRGHGLSDAPPAPYSIDDHVGDLAALMDARGIAGRDRRRAVGRRHDRPGPRRQAARPGRALLVLCDTAHKIGTAEMWNARIEAVRAGGLASIADAVLERWFSTEFRALAHGRSRRLSQHADPHAGRRLCRHLRDLARYRPYSRSTARLTQPTLCLVGEEDGATPPALVRSLSELIPNAAFEIDPECRPSALHRAAEARWPRGSNAFVEEKPECLANRSTACSPRAWRRAAPSWATRMSTAPRPARPSSMRRSRP